MNKKEYKINDVKFYLKNPAAIKNTLIYVSAVLPNDRLRISSGISVNPKNWDKNKQKVKGHNHQLELNKRLDTIKSQINNIIVYLTNNNKKIDKNIVKDLFMKNYDEVKDKSEDFFCLFDEFIENYRFNGKRPSHKSITWYKSVKKKLIDFKDKSGFNFTFDNIKNDFFDKFVDFNQKKGLADNTISTIVNIFKTYMNWAFEKEYHNNLKFKKFKYSVADSDVIVFSMNEINKLEEYDLSFDKELENARNHLLMGVFTGLRYNDMVRLNKININLEKDTIKIITAKNGELVTIPITNKLLKILEKYPKFDFNFKNVNKQNQLIKEVCKIVGIDDDVVRTRRKNGRITEETFKKYELVTTHIGRRTFITQSLAQNVNPEIVKKVSGHRDHRSFRKYIRFAEEQIKDGYKNVFD